MQSSGLIHPSGGVGEGFMEGVTFFPEQPFSFPHPGRTLLTYFCTIVTNPRHSIITPLSKEAQESTLLNNIAFTI